MKQIELYILILNLQISWFESPTVVLRTKRNTLLNKVYYKAKMNKENSTRYNAFNVYSQATTVRHQDKMQSPLSS